MKPYYEDDAVTIYHGDCREVLPALPAEGVEMVAMDPPYFRVVDADWDDQWGADPKAFLSWLAEILELCERALHQRGTLAVFCSPDMSCGVEVQVRQVAAYLNHIVWRKPVGRLGRMNKESMRRFFPTSERIILAEKCRNPDGDLFRFRDHVNHSVTAEVYTSLIQRLVALRDEAKLTNAEVDAMLGKNGMAGHYFGSSQWSLPTEAAWSIISDAMALRGVTAPPWSELRQEFDSRRREFDSRRQEFDSRRREFDSRRREFEVELLSDVWSFDSVPVAHRVGNHPTEKPLPLMRHLLSVMSRTGDTVLDPFMGSGTTLRAAKDLGRKAIGIELEERYCEIAAKRMAQEVLPLDGAA